MTALRPPGTCRATLRIMGTTDVHLHLLAYDYYTDRPAARLGLAHTATLIAEARREAANTLLLDNGDFLQGNPMGDFLLQSRERGPGAAHPAIRVMNLLRYDAATLGNHEFNHGIDTLTTALRDAGFPLVCANVAWRLGKTPAEDDTFLPPYALLDRQIRSDDGQEVPIRIGVIGFAPPQIVQWDRQQLQGALATRDIVEAARAHVPALRAAGADVVVALSHSGIGEPDEPYGSENASAALARVPGIDAIIAGHSHLLFPAEGGDAHRGADPQAGTLFGVPTVMPGFYGSHLGVIDLSLVHDGQHWQAGAATVTLRAVRSDTPAAPAVVQAVERDHAATVAHARRPVGRSDVVLHSYFAPIAPSTALQVVAEAQAAHVARQLAGRPEAVLPILSAVSPFKAGGRGGPENYTHIPEGDLALRHAADLYIFPNTIAALRLTGADLADWLENAAGLFHRIAPDAEDVPLINPDFPSYNHDRIHGLSHAIDLSAPPRFDQHGALRNPQSRRVRDLRFNGKPLDPEAEFILATNSYRAAGCGGYAQARPEKMVDVSHAAIRDILIQHLTDAPPKPPTGPADFRFLPLPGATVTFDTAPEAEAHLPQIAQFRPAPLGRTAEGFVRFRLHL